MKSQLLNMTMEKIISNLNSHLLILVALLLPITISGQNLTEKITWLNENSIEINSISPGDENFDDLTPMISSIGNSRIVLFGEKVHSDGANFDARMRMIKFLHQKMGFDVVIRETGLPVMLEMDKMLTRINDVDSLINSQLALQRSTQTRDLLEYVKASKATSPIELAGFDINLFRSPNTVPLIRKFFRKAELQEKIRVELDFLESFVQPLMSHEPDLVKNIIESEKAKPDSFKVKRLQLYVDQLNRFIAENNSKLSVHHSEKKIKLISHILDNLVPFYNFSLVLTNPGHYKYNPDLERDYVMGKNLIWLMDNYFPGRKIIVLAASGHLLRGNLERFKQSNFKPAGEFLDQRYGEEVYSITFINEKGIEGYELEPPEENSFDYLFSQTKFDFAFLDLKKSRLPNWINIPVRARYLGYGYDMVALPENVNGIFFVRDVYGNEGLNLEGMDVTVEPNPLSNFFRDITGTWQASPLDSSFISQLVYKRSNNQFILNVRNTLTSKSGALFTVYEGVYLYNPVTKSVSFTTITNNEIHTGNCEVKGDTLFHKAQIEGNSNIKSYSSAIVKMKDGTLNYYANYSETDIFPQLSFQNPLIYRKEQP